MTLPSLRNVGRRAISGIVTTLKYLLKIRKYPIIALVLNLYELNEVLKAPVQFQIFLRIPLPSHVSDIY